MQLQRVSHQRFVITGQFAAESSNLGPARPTPRVDDTGTRASRNVRDSPSIGGPAPESHDRRSWYSYFSHKEPDQQTDDSAHRKADMEDGDIDRSN